MSQKPQGKQTREPDQPPPPPAALTLAEALGRLLAAKELKRQSGK